MTTVKVTSNITFEELVNGVLQLPPTDFERFIQKIQAIKAKSEASKKEARLVQQIQERLSKIEGERLKELEQKQYDSVLNEAENQEMAIFIHKIERLHTQRILAIGMLAQLRGTSVEKVSKEFGFQPITNG